MHVKSIDNTLYGTRNYGTREVYSGSILLTGKAISGSDAYIATLVCDGLRMDANSDAVGALINLAEE